jgi:hypothetical protein
VNQQQPGIDSTQGWNVLIYVADCLAYCWEVVIRVPRTVGSEYPGWPVRIGAWCAFPLFLLFAPPQYGAAFVVPAWFLLSGVFAVQFLAGFRSRAAHSHYLGDSWAWKLQPKLESRRVRAWPELGLAVALAAVAALLCDTLAKFILASGICSTISLAMLHERDRRIEQRLRNQQVEAEYYGERFQQRKGVRP